jgi:hypothetical protein
MGSLIGGMVGVREGRGTADNATESASWQEETSFDPRQVRLRMASGRPRKRGGEVTLIAYETSDAVRKCPLSLGLRSLTRLWKGGECFRRVQASPVRRRDSITILGGAGES